MNPQSYSYTTYRTSQPASSPNSNANIFDITMFDTNVIYDIESNNDYMRSYINAQIDEETQDLQKHLNDSQSQIESKYQQISKQEQQIDHHKDWWLILLKIN